MFSLQGIKILTLIGSKRKFYGSIGSGFIVLAAQNAIKNSNSLHLCSAIIWCHPIQAEQCLTEKRNASFLFLDLLQQTSSRVSRASLLYIPIVEPITSEGMRLCRIIRPVAEWSVVSFSHKACGCLEEWQVSEQNRGSFGNEGGKRCILPLLFLCLEAVDNGVAKTFSPKCYTVWADG